MGEFAAAIATGEDGLRLAEARNHSHSEVWMRFGLGYAYLRQGECASAFEVLAQALVKCRKKEFRNALPYVAASMGTAYVGLGRPADGLPLLDEAFNRFAALGLMCFRSFVLTLSAHDIPFVQSSE
jgi:hypothetical protein